MIVLVMTVYPVFTTKSACDLYASELVREFELSGQVGTEVAARLARMNELKGINPTVTWDKTGKVQIGDHAAVKVTKDVDIGLYFTGPIIVTVGSSLEGTSEVFWK
jgi:hypothetical protein